MGEVFSTGVIFQVVFVYDTLYIKYCAQNSRRNPLRNRGLVRVIEVYATHKLPLNHSLSFLMRGPIRMGVLAAEKSDYLYMKVYC